MSEFGFGKLEKEIKSDNQKDISDTISEKYEIIIECADEFEQMHVYNEIKEKGYKCRVSTL